MAEQGKNDKNYMKSLGFPGGLVGKESICNVGDLGSSLDWEDLLEKGKGSHSSILLEESHGQRSLVDDCPWGPRITHNLVTKPPPQTNVKNL